MMGKPDNEDESAGHGETPKDTRFKPGQSGNPAGRPPKARSAARILRDLLLEQVSVRQGKRRRRMPRLEVMIQATLKKAVQGDARAFRALDRWKAELGIVTDEPLSPIERGHGTITMSEYEALCTEKGDS
jgi:hypothetical protein